MAENTNFRKLTLFCIYTAHLKLHEAAVSSKCLAKLKVLNHTWVILSMNEASSNFNKSEKDEDVDGQMTLKLITFEDLLLRGCENVRSVINSGYDEDNDVVYVRQETAFNVCGGGTNIQCYQALMQGNGLTVFASEVVHDSKFLPCFAKSAVVSVVRSPNVSLDRDYTESLKEYFALKRHVNINQLFSIALKDGDTSDARIDIGNRLWFKVTSLKSDNGLVESAWIKQGETMLHATSSTNSFVPLLNSCESGATVSCDTGQLLTGLSDYNQRVEDIAKLVAEKRVAPTEAVLLLHGPPAIGKRLLIHHLQEQYCMHLYEVNCFNVISESIAAMEQRIEAIFSKAIYSSPCILLLRNINALSKYRDGDENEPRLIHSLTKCISYLSSLSNTVFVVATTSRYSELSPDLCRMFMFEIEIEAPDEEERLQTLIGITHNLDMSQCCLPTLAKKTAGMVLGDLRMLISKALSINRLRTGITRCEAICPVTQADVDDALDRIHTEYKDTLGMPKIPDVSWDDVGGLADVKSEIIDTIKVPLLHPELTAKGLRRSGLLLYGPPGCGKTLLAKAVATEFSLNFFSVKGPELINMYVGQSEQNVRDMFKKARECAPCVVFFDELDSIAPNRGKSGDSGGVMDRVVSQLLAELDGMQTSNELFVIGATNRPDLLDNALLRPGRFDKLVYVGFPETKADRMNIIKSYTNKMNLAAQLEVSNIEDRLPSYLTGADMYALCSDAVLNAIRRRIVEFEECGIENEDSGIDNEDSDLIISVDDFDNAIRNLVPSVSTEDVLKYKEIKRKIDIDKDGSNSYK
eukprot:gene11149-12321_t